MARWLAGPLAPLVVLACSNPAGTCEAVPGLDGQWTYEAIQESPVTASIHGSLLITSRQCSDFQGSLDAIEVLATGESRRVSGFVSGTMLDSSLFRLEAVIGGDSREHLARLRADSVSGEWIASAGGVARSGRFAGKRIAGT
jgi:hypothetical protein